MEPVNTQTFGSVVTKTWKSDEKYYITTKSNCPGSVFITATMKPNSENDIAAKELMEKAKAYYENARIEESAKARVDLRIEADGMIKEINSKLKEIALAESKEVFEFLKPRDIHANFLCGWQRNQLEDAKFGR